MASEDWERQLQRQDADSFDEAIRQSRAANAMLGEVYAENKKLRADNERLKRKLEALGPLVNEELQWQETGSFKLAAAEKRVNFILRVMRLVDPFELDEILWRVEGDEIKFFIGCNDCFWWGSADCEEVTPENVGELEKAYADVRAATPDSCSIEDDAHLLFCCRVRKMRPQGCCYPRKELWPLVDDCGPEREVGRGNPYPPGGKTANAQPSYAELQGKLTAAEKRVEELENGLRSICALDHFRKDEAVWIAVNTLTPEGSET